MRRACGVGAAGPGRTSWAFASFAADSVDRSRALADGRPRAGSGQRKPGRLPLSLLMLRILIDRRFFQMTNSRTSLEHATAREAP